MAGRKVHPQVRLTRLRSRAARRASLGRGLRRLLPGIVVGTGTVATTAALAGWVGTQPGVKASTSVATAPPAVAPTTPAPGVQQALQQDGAALASLQATIASLESQMQSRAKASTTGAGAGRPAGSGGAAATTGTRSGQAASASATPGIGLPSSMGPATAGAAPSIAAAPVPTLPTLPPLSAPTPVAPSPSASPATTAPPTQGTTGASHAVP